MRQPVLDARSHGRVGLLAEFAAAGADRCLLALANLDASQTLTALDDWARLIPA